jgi:hypothetical protein
VRFGSVDEFVATEVNSTPLRDRISDEVYRKILDDSHVALRQFRTDAGGVEVPIEGHLVTARTP